MSIMMLDISQNGWEYIGTCNITSEENFEYKRLNKKEYKITFASGVEFIIEFDEEAIVTKEKK